MAYTINTTNGTEIATVEDGTIDAASTSISLVGKNYAGYGEFLNENFVRLLESGANEESPIYPLTGELWYDLTLGALKVYDGEVFKTLGGVTLVTTLPESASNGDLYFNEIEKKLYVYFDLEYHLIGPTEGTGGGGPDDTKLPLAGGTMLGYLVLNADPRSEHPLDAATKGYVDEKVASAEIGGGEGGDPPDLSAYVRKDGSTMTGTLQLKVEDANLTTDENNKYYAVTREYVDTGDENSVKSDGSVDMTAPLDLKQNEPAPATGAPSTIIQQTHAATRKYVDDEVSKAAQGGVSIDHLLTKSGSVDMEPDAQLKLGNDLDEPTDDNNKLHATTREYVDARAGGVPAGSRLAFYNISAPEGWHTVSGVSEKFALQIVPPESILSGTAPGTTSVGGDDPYPTTGHTHVVPSHNHTMIHTHDVDHWHSLTPHTHSIADHDHSVTISGSVNVGSTTLTLSQVPKHQHDIIADPRSGLNSAPYLTSNGGTGVSVYDGLVGSFDGTNNDTRERMQTDELGGGGSHTHSATHSLNGVASNDGTPITGTESGSSRTDTKNVTSSTGSTGTTSTKGNTSTNAGFTPRYMNFILCEKD